LDRFLQALEKPETLPERSALLTFDDGYGSMRHVTLPLLRRYEVPAVLFVPTDYIGRRNTFDAGVEPDQAICHWDHLRELARAGVADPAGRMGAGTAAFPNYRCGSGNRKSCNRRRLSKSIWVRPATQSRFRTAIPDHQTIQPRSRAQAIVSLFSTEELQSVCPSRPAIGYSGWRWDRIPTCAPNWGNSVDESIEHHRGRSDWAVSNRRRHMGLHPVRARLTGSRARRDVSRRFRSVAVQPERKRLWTRSRLQRRISRARHVTVRPRRLLGVSISGRVPAERRDLS